MELCSMEEIMSSPCVFPPPRTAVRRSPARLPTRAVPATVDLTLPSPPRASTAPLRTSEPLSQAMDRACYEHDGDAMLPEVARCRADSDWEETTASRQRATRTTLSAARVTPSTILLPKKCPPSPGGNGVGDDENASKRTRLGSASAPVSPPPPVLSVRKRLFGGASVGKPAGSFSGREIANFSTSGGKEKEAKKKRLKRLSIAAHDRARGLHAHDSGGVAWTAKKRTRQSIDMYVRDVRAELGACENDGDAAASPPARSPHLPEASRARARDGLDEEGDNIGDENQHSASRRGDVGSLLEVAIGAASSVPGTPATPVTAKFRRFLIAASQPGLRRVRSGDFSPQIARMLGKKQIDEVVKSIASKSKEETLKADLHLKTHVACEVLTREYEQQRKDGVEAAAFANVFGAWFGCCEGVMTPRLRKIAEDDEKAGRHDTPAVAVYRLARSVGAVLEHGGHLVDKSVDDVLSVTVTDDTIFAADGKTHHRHGHVHRAGVSTGETRAHQDHSVAGITVAFSKVLRNVNPSDVAHELQLLHYTYVLNLEGAFHDGFGNGSQVELKARHGSVIRRDRYGDTQRDEVRVMTISPVENAHFMHYIANPKGAARVVIQFVIDAGLGVEWAEAATAYLRRFLGERLEPTEVTKTKMTTAARDFLSKDPNKMKSAELPVSDAAKAEAAVAAAAKKAEEAAAAKKKAEEAAAKKKKIAEEAAAKKKKAEEAAAKKKEEAAAAKKKKIAEDAAAAPAMWAAAAAAAEEAPAKKKKKAEEAAAKKDRKSNV